MPQKISQEERYGLERLIGPLIHPMERLRSGIIRLVQRAGGRPGHARQRCLNYQSWVQAGRETVGKNLVLIDVFDAITGSLKCGWYNTQKALCTIKWRMIAVQEQKLTTS
jgi:hypothetical protein